MNMTPEQRAAALGLLRHVLTALGGIAVHHGYVSQESAMEIMGAILVIVPAAWSCAEKFARARAPAPEQPK
jgi:ABC-type nickel/cobalt efflux system permease component RcnA